MIRPTEGYSIAVSPIGDFDPKLIESLCGRVFNNFGVPAIPYPLFHDITFAWNAERRQYHSTPVLERLAAAAPPWAIKVAAIVKVDLYIPILTYVYGEAQLRGKACIISTYRLNKSLPSMSADAALTARIGKEIIHELGHTFNLRHCEDQSCIMHYCRTELDVDRKSEHMCRYCKVLLSDECKRLEKELLFGTEK